MRELPKKKQWADEMLALKKHNDITNTDIARDAELSRPTVIAAMKGKTTYDSMFKVQKTLNKLCDEKI